MKVLDKHNNIVDWDYDKIVRAVSQSAERASVDMTNEDFDLLEKELEKVFDGIETTSVKEIHEKVERALLELFPEVGDKYASFRTYRKTLVADFENMFRDVKNVMYQGDRENANFDSSLTSTKSSIIGGILRKILYKKYYLSKNELSAMEDGYIYIHDLNFLLLGCFNCCLFDMASVLENGFKMANLEYEDIKQFRSACNVIGDLTLSATAQQFGGFTIPEVDKVLLKYAKNSLAKYYKQARFFEVPKNRWKEYAYSLLRYDFEKCLRGLEAKLNTITSSRGDTAFVTFSLGCLDNKKEEDNKLQAEICKYILQTRINGHGKGKAPVVFPKLVFLYSERWLHKDYAFELYELAETCCSRCMYPDMLSLDAGFVGDMYAKTGKVVSPMGCRAYLSDYKDENGESYFVGRGNIGAVSLNLPMIWMKSNGERFYEDLDYYMEMIRNFHKKRYDYIADMPASTNPLCFCEGGIRGGNKRPEEKIGHDILKSFTASFGVTALNELNVLMEGKPLHESDMKEINKVVDYINEKIDKFKKEDGWLYALYGTPAESLCFSGDTIVQVYGGNKCIKDIKVGDLVYSYNESENKIELKPVIRSLMTSEKAVVVNVKFNNGQTVVCTPNHPFAMRKIERNSKGQIVREYIEYVEAKDLKNGDRIKSKYSQYHIVESVEFLDEEIPVYDITVEDNHNFYVGGDDGILVHNCGTQVKQFRKKFGIIKGVSDKEYFTNSFHMHVSADITPFEKMDLEVELFHKFNGGHILYVKLDNPNNKKALRSIIKLGMKLGLYLGINFFDVTCKSCGYHTIVSMDTCPVCKSNDIITIGRVCGYLSIVSYRGESRMNDAKLEEIKDRVSM